jgi:hypothetical protein
VPEWSYGLWLSTSFTTDYDEQTVNAFIDGMAERDIPLSVFHFDCFWMREFHWTDFEWDPRVFPDPEGMLGRLHDRGLRVSAWLNPYIAQRSKLFREGLEAGYLVRRADGTVWQWDQWQAGMALVDFTNPDATAWFQGHLRGLLDQGVDAIKTDFGERIPIDVVWHDGSDPEAMHHRYTELYNRAVFDVLEDVRGRALRALGDGRRPADAGALGRRQLLVVRLDGREPARRTLPRAQRVRILESRHRRLRGRSRPRRVQALARIRLALEPLATARLHELPGAVGLRPGRRGTGPECGRGRAAIREAEAVTASVSRRCG